MVDVLLDALLDSLKVFAVVLAFNILISFIENWLAKKIEKNKKISPILGAAFGLIPQCGFSVVASDLYIKEHITMGTLVAVFIACSDESLPIIISNFNEAYMALPLLGIKFVLGFAIGYLVDVIVRERKHVNEHLDHCEHEEEIHVGCCHHHIEDEEESKVHKHLLHPLIHSLKVLLYVFIINIIFGTIIYFVGEEQLSNFLMSNRYVAPLFATIIGLIPNCASSVILTELFIKHSISFGACLSGLIINAGLGTIVLFKNKDFVKKGLIIISILFIVSIVSGYVTCLIMGF